MAMSVTLGLKYQIMTKLRDNNKENIAAILNLKRLEPQL